MQGCSIRCPGCAVPHTWAPDAGELVSADELARRILAEPEIEGVTFLGGEPFDQAAGLATIAQTVGAAGLSVMTFTGHVLEDLRASSRRDWHTLLDATDLLVDGPYRSDLADLSMPWKGSSNQRILFLTERYRHLEGTLSSIPNGLEIRVDPRGHVFINGLVAGAELHQLGRIAAGEEPRRW